MKKTTAATKITKGTKKTAPRKAAASKRSGLKANPVGSASQLIDAKIKELGDWRGEMLARIRRVIKEADPQVVEEVKWRGVPVWEHAGIICTGETYKEVVKMTFHKRVAAGSRWALQLQPRRQRPPGDRHSRRGEAQREGSQGADPRGGGAEYEAEGETMSAESKR